MPIMITTRPRIETTIFGFEIGMPRFSILEVVLKERQVRLFGFRLGIGDSGIVPQKDYPSG